MHGEGGDGEVRGAQLRQFVLAHRHAGNQGQGRDRARTWLPVGRLRLITHRNDAAAGAGVLLGHYWDAYTNSVGSGRLDTADGTRYQT
jgi:hypothetical protein